MIILCLKMGKLRLGGIFANFKGVILCFTWTKISILQRELALQTHSFPPGKSWPFVDASRSSCSPDADQRSHLFGCRLEPNGGRKKQLLGFLQLLLVFLLQREKKDVWRPLALVAQALLGLALSAMVLWRQMALGRLEILENLNFQKNENARRHIKESCFP